MNGTDNKLLYEILVPARTGKVKVKKGFHQQWDEKIRSISGGLTILRPAKGHWISPSGTTHVERMIPVRVWATTEQMELIAQITASHYKQEAVMYYVVSQQVTIKHFG